MHGHAAMRRRRPDFTRLFLAQGFATLLVALLAGLRHGHEGVLSALMGGLVSLLPSLYFVWRGLRVRDGRRPRVSVMNLYQAAMGKFGLTVALFVIVFVAVPPSNPAFFFVAYVAAQLMHWLTPWLLRDRPTQRT
ncbi:F0F1 ATP synthase assembly protein I [Halomonas daqingensis]|uniref:F0F1 ATP synthase assembly protein I n=1 Tax=Billgrantia desiderata TaxID=52021 RepID=A0ABS9BAC2_9GAMM|nr:F0F1 ATP synthase assembly protein I [Halomonas desiderata]MCE8049041.1 F0F1 ATP synthase assembly protein I [Halomonas desiderata]